MKKKSRGTRIGHVYHGSRMGKTTENLGDVPRGWIHPDGRFFKTKHHWNAISDQLGDGEQYDDPAEGERNAHKAYSRGWISIGHGGALNAVGHKSTFDTDTHPAVETLRKLVSKVPHFTFRVEKQLGKLNSDSGRHEDFDVKEYDLDWFIRRGRLRKPT